MYCLNKLIKSLEYNRKKQKINNIKNYVALATLGAVIGGAAVGLFTQGRFEKTKNIIIRNVEDIVKNAENIVEDVEDIVKDVNINKDEIKQTEEKVSEESLGDLGTTMENRPEDLESGKENDNNNEIM